MPLDANTMAETTHAESDEGQTGKECEARLTGHDSPEASHIAPDQPVVVYSSRSEIRHPVVLLRQIYCGFTDGRELAWRIFLRNLNGLYRQTLLGLFWAFLPPIANTAIWIFLKSQNVFEMGDTGVDSSVYILAGMILWQAFIDAFHVPSNILNNSRSMISRLNFPRESLLLVGFGETLFNLAIRLALLIPAFVIFGVPLHTGILWAPLPILAMILLGIALGLLLMPLGSLYKDVGRFISMFIPFWMIITPIIYVPPTTFPGTLLNWVNPASPLLLVSRDLLLIGETNHALIGMLSGLLVIPLLLTGLVIYRISMPILIERMPN